MWKYQQAILFFFKALHRNFVVGRCLDNAGILTITTLLALVPMITMVYSAMRLMPGMESIGDQIQDWIFSQFIPSKAGDIQETLARFTQQTSKLTLVGSIMLVITSIMMLIRVEGCLNAIWQVSSTKAGVVSFLKYWAVLSLGPICIGAGVLLTSYFTSMKAFNDAFEFMSLQSVFLMLFPIFLTLMALTLIYVAVPNCSVPFFAGFVGACVAALLFEIAKRAFAWSIATFPSYELIYGAFAALPIFVIWLNLSWVIILLGGAVSRTLSTDFIRRRKLSDIYAGVEIIAYFHQAQSEGFVITERSILKNLSWLPRDQWDDIRALLTNAGLITSAHKGYVLLTRVDGMTKAELLHQLGWVQWLDGQKPQKAEAPSAYACYEEVSQFETHMQNDVFNQPLIQWLEPKP